MPTRVQLLIPALFLAAAVSPALTASDSASFDQVTSGSDRPSAYQRRHRDQDEDEDDPDRITIKDLRLSLGIAPGPTTLVRPRGFRALARSPMMSATPTPSPARSCSPSGASTGAAES
jgi:hypothetical protein